MRPLPDPKQHLDEHMQRAARKYVDGLRQAGLEPTPTLTRAVAERAGQEAFASYVREAHAIRDQNIALILQDHDRRQQQFRREGARLRLKVCPFLALWFGLLAWFNVTQHHIVLGIICAIGALAFLAMLVFGAIFDRSRARST